MNSSQALKIVHLTSSHYADDARILHKECRSLVKAGHDVTLVARNGNDAVVDGVKIRALRSDPARRLQRWTKAVWRAYREASRLDADVYHFHDPELIPVGIWLTACGKRVIYDAHEDLPKTFAYKHYLPKFGREGLGWLTGKIENFAARRFAGVVAATPGIANRFSSQNKNTVLVRNFPILDELGKAAPMPWNERPPLVAYVGSTGPERGIRECVKAVGSLPKELNARFALGGPISPELRRQIEESKGGDRTEILGRLGRGEVANLLSRARVGLVLALPVPNLLTALPVKLFEYMNAGVPVVASDFPIWREIVAGSRCGVLVNPRDAQGVARAIEHMLTHPDEAREMGERGRVAVVERYNWRTEEKRLIGFYGMATGQPQTQAPA
ncbi:MAG TPA: glycosyltransferase family 4 protein [Candidatus Acidoferrales bacterium]|nr:glycosyltransferase family 4 protein [Candidatus Acidoferrales bacterium]